jgi:SpoIID/LytB domain protein
MQTLIDIETFISRQLEEWHEVRERYEALRGLQIKTLHLRGVDYRVQFNPARAVSTAAKVDAATIATRPCFLCDKNRPLQQHSLQWDGYNILVNPFPIFPRHLTIVARNHTPQTLRGRVEHFRELSRLLPGYTIFFNGAHAGASAPDHQHFQAVPSEYMSAPSLFFSYLLPEGEEFCGDDGMINATAVNGEVRIIPRRQHRPNCYGEMLVSPASIDLSGTMITVRKEDFDRMDEAKLQEILDDVTFREPEVAVGIMQTDAPKVTTDVHGIHTVENVTIGVGFHWERKENQRFAGKIELKPLANGKTQVLNTLGVEEYLRSVISSEMSATSSLELLKAHAVISRSWLLAQMRLTRSLVDKGEPVEAADAVTTENETVRWYDHDDHDGFDVCADDHCQRYQGVTRVSTPAVDQAIAATRGLVLATADGHICDARFSKCCGGVFERFENCWQPRSHSYLIARADNPTPLDFPDLSVEQNAVEWIRTSPKDCFCNTADAEALSQVLNDYDRESADFFRWTVRYSVAELSALVAIRSGIDFGEILALNPLERGTSGRITRLQIVGSKHTHIVGKELEIRRWLSTSHLRSSAFFVERAENGDFLLHGSGWGHGVGLCQIGAAMMALRGYDFRQILAHYFPGTELKSLYE